MASVESPVSNMPIMEPAPTAEDDHVDNPESSSVDSGKRVEDFLNVMRLLTGRQDLTVLEALIALENAKGKKMNTEKTIPKYRKGNKHEVLIHQDTSEAAIAKAKAAEEAFLKELEEEESSRGSVKSAGSSNNSLSGSNKKKAKKAKKNNKK